MADLQDLILGLKGSEETSSELEKWATHMQNLEKLASLVESGKLQVARSQMEKRRSDQVQNSAGGFVFKVDDVTRIRRFLMLGTTGGTYYASQQELTLDNVRKLCKLIQEGKGLILLREILNISLNGRAPKQNPTMFALALCARYKVCDTKNKQPEQVWKSEGQKFFGSYFNQEAFLQTYLDYQRELQLAALLAVPKICRIPTHLFMFLKYCKLVSSETGLSKDSKGWGRALREAISNWYFNIEPEKLAVLVTKYRNREGYSHRDLFRLCHIVPKSTFSESHIYWKYHAEYDFIFDFIAHDMDKKKKREISEWFAKYSDQFRQMKRKTEYQNSECQSEQSVTTVEDPKIEQLREKMHNLASGSLEDESRGSNKEDPDKKEEGSADSSAQRAFNEKNKKVEKRIKSRAQCLNEKKKRIITQDLRTTRTFKFIAGFQYLKTTIDVEKVVKLIYNFGFVREHIPTILLTSKEIWGALLHNMPMTAMLRNLGKMASLGLLDERQENRVHVHRVITKLTDPKAIKEARIHPIGVLLASSVYKKGKGIKGALKWEPLNEIKNALDKAFLLAFKNVPPTGKRYCVALDVSGSMSSLIAGTHISCRVAACAMSTVILRTEPQVQVVALTKELTELNFTKSTPLDDVINTTKNLPYGATDCAQPMLWALKTRRKFDVFCIYTDNETWYGKVHPFEALKRYRNGMKIRDARLIVMGMTATNFSIADPTDPGMLDVCGFDSAVPDLVREFVLGRI